MFLTKVKPFRGWFVLAGCVLVMFGVAGGQFSFGVFLKPMTEDFNWSRGTLSLAFGLTFMLSGLLRPLAGYLADRYSPKIAALAGVLIMGVMLLLIPLIDNLLQLFLIFTVMSIGITLGTGPILVKVVSSWFHQRRGLTLGMASGAGSLGAMILVPGAAAFTVAFDWRDAYWFLGVLLLGLVLPAGYLLIRNRPEDLGLRPYGAPSGGAEGQTAPSQTVQDTSEKLMGRDATFREAIRTPIFMKLTFGYFV